MSANLEIPPPEKYDSRAISYRFRKNQETSIRIVNEETFRYLTERPISPASVLRIYDEEGREILAIERGND